MTHIDYLKAIADKAIERASISLGNRRIEAASYIAVARLVAASGYSEQSSKLIELASDMYARASQFEEAA